MNLNISKRFSPKTGVILFTLAIFLTGIWSLAFYASRMLREDLQTLLGEQQFSTVSYIADEVNHELGERLRALEKIAGRITPAMLGNTAISQTFIEDRPIIQSLFNGGIFVTRLDGTATASFPLSIERIGVNYMDRDYMAAALKEGKASIGQPVMGRVTKTQVLPMAAPIRDAQGQVIGSLVGITNLGKSNFLDKITQNRYGKTGGYLLAAPQQRLIVTATDKRLIMTALPAAGVHPQTDRFVQGDEGSAVFLNPAGVEVLASVKGIPSAGWYLALDLPTKEAFAPVRALQQRLLEGAILLSLLAGSLAWWLTSAVWKRLTQQEQKFRTLLESSPDPMVISDAQGLITLVNRQAVALFGYEPQELLGQPVELLLPQRSRGGHVALRQGYTAAPEVREMGKARLLRAVTKEGRELPVNINLSSIQTEQGLLVAAAIRDISEQQANEVKIRRLTDLYAALNQCRQAIVRCASEEELFLQICRAAVEFGGMKMARIDLLDETNQMVKPVAWYGMDTAYLEGLQVSVNADEPTGRGGTGTAIRENRPVWIQDFQNDPSLAPWHERAARAGWRATAALPLRRQGKVIGAFRLHAGELNAFDEVARNLLLEMARDIGQALDHYRLQAERQQVDEALRESEARLRCLIEMSSDFYWETDVEHRLTLRSESKREASESVFQQSPSVGLRRWEIPSLSPDEAGWQAHRALLDAHLPFRDFVIARPRANGAVHHIAISGDPVFDAAGHFKGYRGVGADITERQQMQEQVRQLAFHDTLTQLPNRRLFNDRLSQAMAASKRSACYGALMFLDLDNFKPLNDLHGHVVGDLLLIEAADRLKSCVREIDTVARFGGDEFVVLLGDLNADKAESTSQAETVAEKIRVTLSAPYLLTIKHEGKGDTTVEHRCTVSIGVALFINHEASQEDILKWADAAMYQAKEAGRNLIRFSDSKA